jgi:hypothetical protein
MDFRDFGTRKGVPDLGQCGLSRSARTSGRDTLQVKATSTRRLVGDPALGWSQGLKVEVGGAGTVAQAGWCCRGCWLTGWA